MYVKVRFCTIVILLLLSVFSEAQNTSKHFTAGMIVGGVGASLSNKPVLAGVVVGTGAGIAKEWHDHFYHKASFDGRDVVYTALGGLVSGLIIKQIRKRFLNHKHKRK